MEETAVRWRVFNRTVQDIRARNADTGPDDLQRTIDDAVREVRAERRAKAKADEARPRSTAPGKKTCAEQPDELRAE